jgi:hypothetical protein
VSGNQRQQRRVEPTRSYLSQVETTLSFGLGTRDRIDHADITWPDGHRQRIREPSINRRHRITATGRSPGFAIREI